MDFTNDLKPYIKNYYKNMNMDINLFTLKDLESLKIAIIELENEDKTFKDDIENTIELGVFNVDCLVLLKLFFYYKMKYKINF